MKKTQTKRALLLSALSIVLCCTMLIGVTFAWFTDTASTNVNTIQSGSLDVGLEMLVGDEWLDAEDQTVDFVKSPDAPEGEVLRWEPGCTYDLQQLRVVNHGNLALKYKVVISGISGSSKLAQVLEWKLDGAPIADFEGHLSQDSASDPFTISAHMKENADSDYMNQTLKGVAITVYATQYAEEYDSIDNTYDAAAEFPELVGTEDELQTALAEGKNIRLSKDIALSAPLTLNGDVEVIGDGHAVISEKPVNVAADANVTFTNVNFALPTNARDNASSVYASGFTGKLIFDGCTFTNPQWECIQVTPKNGTEIIVTNCTFIVDGTGVYAKADGTKVERMLHIQNTSDAGDYKVTIVGNTFVGVDLVNNSVIDVDEIAAFANVACGQNTFCNHDGSAVSTMPDSMIYINLTGRYDATGVASNTYAQFTQATAASVQP